MKCLILLSLCLKSYWQAYRLSSLPFYITVLVSNFCTCLKLHCLCFHPSIIHALCISTSLILPFSLPHFNFCKCLPLKTNNLPSTTSCSLYLPALFLLLFTVNFLKRVSTLLPRTTFSCALFQTLVRLAHVSVGYIYRIAIDKSWDFGISVFKTLIVTAKLPHRTV